MSDQNNQQGSTSPANIAGRKIAVPRRRLARAASSDGASNPMAGFTFGNTGAPSGQPGFTTATSAFGNQPQQSPPTFGRSFSEAGGFQANMPQQQQQPSDLSAPSSPSTGFTFGSKTGLSFPSNKPKTDFQFGSGSLSAPANQPASFSFGTAPVSSTSGGESTTPSSQPGFSFGNQSAMTPLSGFKPSSAFGGSTMDEDAMDKDEAPAEKSTGFSTAVSSSESTFTSTGASTSGFSFPPSSSTSSGFTFPAKSSSGFTFGGSNTSFKLPSAGENTGFSFSAATTPAVGFGATSQAEQSTTATTSSSAAVAKPAFSFGTGTTQTTLTSTPAFSFGKPSTAPSLSFGTPAASKEPESESTKAPTTGLSFPTPTVVPAPAEETPSESPKPAEKKETESSAPKFSFGTTSSSATAAKPTPAFSFGSAFQPKPQEAADKDAGSEEATASKPADTATSDEGQAVVKKDGEEKGKETEESGDKAAETEDSEETPKDAADKKEEPAKGASSDSTDTKSSGGFFTSSSPKSSGEPSTSQSIAIPATPTFSIAATTSTTKKGTEAVDKGASSFMFSSGAKPSAPTFGSSTSAFGGSALTATPSSSSSEKSAPTPAFSFGTGTQSSTGQTPAFSFGSPKSTFTFGKATDASSSTSTTSATPAFSFGTSGASTAKPAPGTTPGPSPFVFPSSASTSSTSQPKEKAAAPTPSAAPATTQPATPSTAPKPGTAFTFGTASTDQSDKPAASTATSGPSPFSFSTTPSQESTSSTSESSKKRKSNEQISAVESSRQKFVHGKSPLSQSWSAEEGGNKAPTLVTGLSGAIPPRKRSVDSAGMVQPTTSAPEKKVLTDVQNKENRPAEKHVSFKLPDGSKSEDKGKSVDKPELVSPFKPLQSKPIEIPASQAPLSALKSQSTSSDVIGPPSATKAEQTVLDSKIANPESIEKRTRYRDLPDNAQNELNLVYKFIEDQINISKKIETRQLAHNGELLSEVEGYADRCTKELRLHHQSLTMTKENLHELASAADYQVQNAMVAQLFFDNTSIHGRSSTGTTIHQRYFADLADSLHERCGNYRAAINQLEERVDTMMRGNENASPDNIPAIIQSQSQTLMGLTAKVSDLHQEVEKMKRNYQTLR